MFVALDHQLQQPLELHHPFEQHQLPCSLHNPRDLDSQRERSDDLQFDTLREMY